MCGGIPFMLGVGDEEPAEVVGGEDQRVRRWRR